MRPLWSGAISFGLVNIPIKLYSAIQHKAVSFKMLHKHDNSPIKYKKWCEKENKEVAWEEVAKAIQVSKNEFYLLTEEEMKKLKPEKSSLIQIVEFVDASRVDPIYFDSHYYIAPEKEMEKAYFLFREVLQLSGKLAIAKFVMREKEHTCTISSYKNGLLLSTLNYSYEIRDIAELDELKAVPKLSNEEISLAKQLINKLYTEEFDITKFKDTFAEQLHLAIEQKEKGIVELGKPKKKSKNLMDALKASLK